jgi:hypothetical protein
MAKVKMICPFSGKLCKECPVYRGRHYLLCFNKKYRGYLKGSGEIPKVNADVNFRVDTKDLFNLQALSNAKPIDPFTVDMPDVK